MKNDPSLAPKGGADYLEGPARPLRRRVVRARHRHPQPPRRQRRRRRTYYVADLLLQTARGAAVVELEFDSLQLISDTVTDVRELEPREIKGLDDADLTAVAKALRRPRRRGRDELRHGRARHARAAARRRRGRAATPPPAAKPKQAAVSPEIRKAKQQLRCVQRAKGDVEKLARCAS